MQDRGVMRGGGVRPALSAVLLPTDSKVLFYSALREKIKTVHYNKTTSRTVTKEQRENMRVKKRASDSHLFPPFFSSLR